MVGDRRIELRWRAFTEPAAPRASPQRNGRIFSCRAELRVRTGIEPVSLHRQWSCLTRCIADLAVTLGPRTCRPPAGKSGRPPRASWGPRLVRLVRLERTLRARSTHSLCRLGYRRVKNKFGGPGWIQTNAGRAPGRLRGGCRRSLGYWSRSENVESLKDVVGLAPTMRRLRARRAKSPVRSLLGSRGQNAACLCCSCLLTRLR
jgi:hypothetical protein